SVTSYDAKYGGSACFRSSLYERASPPLISTSTPPRGAPPPPFRWTSSRRARLAPPRGAPAPAPPPAGFCFRRPSPPPPPPPPHPIHMIARIARCISPDTSTAPARDFRPTGAVRSGCAIRQLHVRT